MATSSFTCPRCFSAAPAQPEARFCPRCGLADVQRAAMDTSPVTVTSKGRSFTVRGRIAVGSACTLYHCRFYSGRAEVNGVFKIARDARSNDLLVAESQILRHLHARDADGKFAPFLPLVEDAFAVDGDPLAPARLANVLRMNPAIRSPDDLYSLTEVLGHYPTGLETRDMAWIWRRILTVLGFVHSHGVVHGAVLPMHVMIEPKEHKLVLIDWCYATMDVATPVEPIGGYADWYDREDAVGRPPSPALDIALAARCMIQLIGGDPLECRFPASVEPELERYFRRCVNAGPNDRPNAWMLLDDFDRTIEHLWGPRRFRKLSLPPRRIA